MKCKRCGEQVGPNKYRRLICRDCLRKQNNECRYELKRVDPDEYARRKFNDRLWSLYRLRREDYDAMLTLQGNRCAACRGLNTMKRGWHVDHDHKCCPGPRSCGKCVRGLLCHGCNTALGHCDDDVTRLMALAEYVAHHPLVVG